MEAREPRPVTYTQAMTRDEHRLARPHMALAGGMDRALVGVLKVRLHGSEGG